MADMKKQAFALSFASKWVVLAAHKLRYNMMILHGDKLDTLSTVMTSHVIIIIIIIIIIFIYCNWVVTRWQWLFYMYTKHEIGYY